jgi:hypothetical protein
VSRISPATIEAAEITPDFVRHRLSRRRVVEVHDRGELVGGFLSPQALAHYRALANREIEVFQAGEFPDDIVAALKNPMANMVWAQSETA